MKRLAAGLFLMLAVWAAGGEGIPPRWEGQLLKPVAREEVYEFAETPRVRKVGRDRYEVAFAAKGKCDVGVAVEDDRGRIVRHIVYGVLGPNAPGPLKKNSLEQTLVWNGKDDFRKYVERPEGCRVRVSLGLKPTFDRVMAWHPKDTTQILRIAAIDADKDGVYVLETCSYNQLRKFDHDANYVETLIPWNPEKLAKIRMPKRTQLGPRPSGQDGRDRLRPRRVALHPNAEVRGPLRPGQDGDGGRRARRGAV